VPEAEWLLLNFTLPKEPSRARVSVWRKLKKSGSVNIGQAMWLLPARPEHVDEFEEIAAEVGQNNGEAYIFQAQVINRSSPSELSAVFNRARDEEYRELLEKCADFSREIAKETDRENFTFAEVEENEYEYQKLVAWYQKIADRDFFAAPLKSNSEAELNKCQQLLEAFSEQVYALNIQPCR